MRVTEHYVSGTGFTFVFRLVSITLYQHTIIYGNTPENKFTIHICFGEVRWKGQGEIRSGDYTGY